MIHSVMIPAVSKTAVMPAGVPRMAAMPRVAAAMSPVPARLGIRPDGPQRQHAADRQHDKFVRYRKHGSFLPFHSPSFLAPYISAAKATAPGRQRKILFWSEFNPFRT